MGKTEANEKRATDLKETASVTQITTLKRKLVTIPGVAPILLRKDYYCFTCEKRGSKMVSQEDLNMNGLICDTCGNSFCEIIDQSNARDLAY